MVASTERKRSLNKSVDDLMPLTVEEASRRRSNPQDEMQRILAYNAQVNGKRATPRRQGTGREITVRPLEFRKRVVANVEVEPEPKQLPSDFEDVEEPELSSMEVIVRRGRRTGVRMKTLVPKDEFGLEVLSEFWMAEEESTRLSLLSKSGSSATDSSVLSHTSAGTNSFADSRSVDASAETQASDDGVDDDDSRMSDASRTPASTGRSRTRSARSSAAPSSRSSTRSSAASSQLDSPSDTKLLSDDSPSGGLDASKQRLTFGSSDKRLSNLSADSISPSDSERALKRRSRVSFADSGSKRKSSVSFAKTPKARESMATQSPHSDQEDVQDNSMADMPSPMDDSGAGAFDEGGSASASPNLDSSMMNSKGKRASDVSKKGDDVKSASKNKGRKRQAEDGRMVLVDRHETMGRASYCETDSYAPKASRLSEIAPRPQVDEGGERRSKRRKMRPLQYWRGERVDYARASGAAVPEVVDLTIRSPEATPWRRKPPKSQQADVAETAGHSSADSKAKTIRKTKKTGKAKGKAAAVSSKVNSAGVTSAALDKENVPTGQVDSDVAKKQLKKRTPFFIFCTEKRGEVREAHPDMAITEQAKVLGRMWGALTEQDKNRYQQLASA